ncbi:MAG: hypothetical protein AB8F26_01805 [Phycisphaerales bacterium]
MTLAARHHGMRVAHRRGVSFLEAVLGVVLLGLVTASLASAVSFMHKADARLNYKLSAAELGNRLILQFIDDRESLPSSSLPIEYGQALYRWEIEEQPVKFVVRDDGTSTQSGGVGGGASLDRVRYIVVRVWLATESGGGEIYEPGVPGVVLSRLIDPLAFSNPDSLQTLIEQPGGIDRLMQLLMELEDGTAGGTR